MPNQTFPSLQAATAPYQNKRCQKSCGWEQEQVLQNYSAIDLASKITRLYRWAIYILRIYIWSSYKRKKNFYVLSWTKCKWAREVGIAYVDRVPSGQPIPWSTWNLRRGAPEPKIVHFDIIWDSFVGKLSIIILFFRRSRNRPRALLLRCSWVIVLRVIFSSEALVIGIL